LVADAGTPTRPLELAAAIAPIPGVAAETAAITPDQLATVAWEETALLLWQAPLPQGADAEQVQDFINEGGQAIFLPPATPTDAQFMGLRWTQWKEPDEPVVVDFWRSDEDLLARTESGAALPVGELSVRRYCVLAGDATPLASLRDRTPLLARAPTQKGGAYFLATTTAVKDSSLATNGVALYALVQRALAEGTERLSHGRQVVAGESSSDGVAWRQLAGSESSLSTEYPSQAGVYTAGERTLAVNRSAAEDRAAVLDAAQVERLFDGLHYDRVDDAAGSNSALTREIWRLFLVGMVGALVVEAGLCLPRRPRATGGLS
jgi:hypothetical protein